MPLGRQREMLIGGFFHPSAYWVNVDEKLKKSKFSGASLKLQSQ
jgi:hypothetical protein